MAKTTIKEPTLRELAQASSLRGAIAVGQRGGFAVAVRYEATDVKKLLATARGSTRIFTNLNTLANYLQKLGINHFEVDATDYEPARVRPARPDRAAALKQTRTKLHQARLEFLKGSP